MPRLIFLFIPLLACINISVAKTNEAKTMIEDEICIELNSIPSHQVGKSPNRTNPNAIEERRVRMCVPLISAKGGHSRNGDKL